MRTPYIGITGYWAAEEVQRMMVVFDAKLRLGQDRRHHVGVMMSHRTLNALPTRWAGAFPPNGAVAGVFAYRRAMNCLHYADYGNRDVVANLTKAISFGGGGINALQLDMNWPNPDHVAQAIAASGKNLEVILQVGELSFAQSGNNPGRIVDQLRAYDGLIHYVLLDASVGRGIGLDAGFLIPFIAAIQDAYPNMNITVAGGLGPRSMHLIEPIVRLFPEISIDAQGQLRPSGSSLDPVDWGMAEEYLVQALKIL